MHGKKWPIPRARSRKAFVLTIITMADPNRSWSKDSAANTPDSQLSDQEVDNMPISAEDKLVEKVTRVLEPDSSQDAVDNSNADATPAIEGPGPGIYSMNHALY